MGPTNEVVVYSAGEPMWATRLWWLLRVYGFDRVAVLDGGLAAWRAAGLPLTGGVEQYPAANFAAHPRPELLADQPEIELSPAASPIAARQRALADVFAGRGATIVQPARATSRAA